MPPTHVLQDMTSRLQDAAAAAAAAHATYRARIRDRDQLIVQAVDEGMAHRPVADAVGFKGVARVTAILAASHDDDDQDEDEG